MSEVNLSQDERDANAAALGLVVVEPTDFELFIDLDNRLGVEYDLLNLIEHAGLPVSIGSRWPSKTAGHFHAVLVCHFRLDAMTRIALQAAFGSDPKREILSVARVVTGVNAAPTVFFETAERAAWIEERRRRKWEWTPEGDMRPTPKHAPASVYDDIIDDGDLPF